MRDKDTTASEMLAAWRARRGDRLDPLRWRFLDALARRTDAHQGEARRLLEQKLSARLDAYAAELDGMPAAAGGGDSSAGAGSAGVSAGAGAGAGADDAAEAAPAATTPARGPLGELLDRLADDATHDAAKNAMPPAARPLPALDDARKLWTELHGRSQLRQSLQQAPSDAGPLNSGVLVHRALALMRTLSPGYLQQFVAYVDTLSWLERMHEDGALAPRPQARAAVGAKPARKPRKRS